MAKPSPTPAVDARALRDFFENANDACALFTLEGRITAVNRGAERLLGWPRAELLGQHVSKVATPATVALAEERSQRFAAGDKPPSSVFAAELLHKDGRIVVVEARTRALRDAKGQLTGYQGIFRDLTERRQAEATLRQSEERYHSIFEACPDLVYLTDLRGRLLEANPAVARWTGVAREQLPGRHFLEFFAGDNRQELLQQAAELAQGVPVRGLVIRAQNAQGEQRDYEINATPVHDAQGGITALLSIARDVTTRQAMEQALRESQRLRDRIADTLPDLVYIYDLQAQRTRLVNRQVTALLGYAPEEVQAQAGALFGAWLHPEDAAVREAQTQELARARPGEYRTSQVRVRHASGEYRWLQCRETVFTRTPEGTPREVLGVAADITEQKRLGQLLRQQTLDPAEVGRRLQAFRTSLGMTQAEFGAYLGGYDQGQISNYERGRSNVPVHVLLALRAQGHPFEAVLGAGPTAVLHETVRYLAASHRERVVTRALLELALRLVQRDAELIERVLRETDTVAAPLSPEHQKVLDQLAALDKPPA